MVLFLLFFWLVSWSIFLSSEPVASSDTNEVAQGEDYPESEEAGPEQVSSLGGGESVRGFWKDDDVVVLVEAEEVDDIPN